MKRSTLYLLHPESKALERSIASAIGLLDAEAAAAAAPDTQVAVADKFRFTRGNYEHHRFNSRILEPLRDALEAKLATLDRAQSPSDWTQTQCALGNILAALGQQRRDAASFEHAIQCFDLALDGLSQETSPNEWAATQYDLGTANQALGRLQESTQPLKRAIDAYTAALMVWSREASPREWMTTMHQLGATFHTYGLQLQGNRQMQKSVVAYKNALAVLDADDYALELTATHNNRAAVLHHLAESEDNPERLQEAIRSYEKALTVSMEQQLPIHVAVLCRVNKATAQHALAQLTNDIALAEEIADEFEVIVECFQHALQPLCLRHCEEQLKQAQTLARPAMSEG